MKSATKHAEDLKALMKRLSKEYKPAPREKVDPLRALVRAAVLFDVPDERADDAMKAIEKEFVDLNELRVATEIELHELLGNKFPQVERRVTMFTQGLTMIFEKEHTLKLDRLATISKRDARQFVRELPEVHPFVEAYVMLMSFDGACVPVDDMMVQFLIEEGVLEPKTDLDEAQKFLEHNLKAEECYDFFMMVRNASLAHADESAKKAAAKKKK